VKRLAVVLALLGIAAPSRGADLGIVPDSGQWQGISPDGKHLAVLAERPDEELLWRTDIDTGLLEIVDVAKSGEKIPAEPSEGHLGNYHLFELGHRAGIRAEWSPDSRYLVITTTSNGGHSPWHFDSYLYCADNRTLRYMDDVTGLVVRPSFRFTGPHTVRLSVGQSTKDGVDFDHPEQVDVDLDRKSGVMKTLDGDFGG
jgi:hypothetical protein